jgi:outer membrane lipase/esterase
MRRLRVTTAMVLVAGGLLLSSAAPANAQGLNDVLIRLLSNNCAQLGVPTVGPLATLCPVGIPTTGSASSAGASATVESRLGESEEQRRESRRLAERRAGGGGSPDQPGTGFGVFVNGDYQFLKKDNTRFETGFDQHTAGTTVGLDYSFRGRAIVGVALSYAHEFGDFNGVNGGFDNDRYGINFYGSVVPLDNFFVDGFIGYTRKEYSFDRHVNLQLPTVGGTERVALGRIDSDTSADEFHVGATVGYDFIVRNFTVGPRVGVNYSDTRIASFHERGDTGIELRYDNQNIVSLTTSAGIFASMAISTGFGVLVPQVTAEYVHEFLNDQRSVGFTFVNTPSRPRFLFQTDEPDRDFFNIGIGTVLVLPGGKTVYVNVRQLLGYDTRSATTVTAGLRVPF